MADLIISRKAAFEMGLRRFYTGIPCKHGHVAERFVVNGGCTACVNKSYRHRQNAFSHDLKAFNSSRLWVHSTLQAEELPKLERYLQVCIIEFIKHAGKLTPDLEDSFRMQLERM